MSPTGTALFSYPTDWVVEGTGDFNGDGRDDVLFWNYNGSITAWLGTATGSFDTGAFSTSSFRVLGRGWDIPADWNPWAY